METIDRLQGLIELYNRAGKSRNAVMTMADYFILQKRMTQSDMDALVVALDAQDAQKEPLDIGAALAERDELKIQVETIASERDELAAQNIALQEQVDPLPTDIGGGKILAQ